MNKRVNKKRSRVTEANGETSTFRPQSAFGLAIAEHKKHFWGGLHKLLEQPIANLMTVLVIAIALTLPAVLYLIAQNGSALTERWQTSNDISVYLDNKLTRSELTKARVAVEGRNDVANVRAITADAALKDLGKNSELDLISEALPDNPLPHTLVITPASEESLTELTTYLKSMPNVDSVEFDTGWVMKLKNIMNFLTRLIWFLGVILALGVMLIVGNTIRLHVNNRRNEIEVKKLIGASDRFVRRPFLYSGLWYGFFGALLAWILVGIMQLLARGPLSRLLDAYASTYQLNYLGFFETLALLASGTLLALAGAWIAAESSIRKIEP